MPIAGSGEEPAEERVAGNPRPPSRGTAPYGSTTGVEVEPYDEEEGAGLPLLPCRQILRPVRQGHPEGRRMLDPATLEQGGRPRMDDNLGRRRTGRPEAR